MGTDIEQLDDELDRTDLAALMGVVARLESWRGWILLIHMDDGAAGWHQASFGGRLIELGGEDAVELIFEDGRTALSLYGDLVATVGFGDPDSIYLDLNGPGAIEIHATSSG